MNEPREPAPGDPGPTAAAQTLLGWIVGAQPLDGHQITVDDTYIHKDGQEPGMEAKGDLHVISSPMRITTHTTHLRCKLCALPAAIKTNAGAAFRCIHFA